MKYKITYTHVGSLLHAALDILPDGDRRAALLEINKEAIEDQVSERERAISIITKLYEGLMSSEAFEEEEDDIL